MKVVFELPSNRAKEVKYICHIADNMFTKYPTIGFAISANGKEFSPDFKIVKYNIVVEYKKAEITNPCISLVELRENANKLATNYFNPEFRVMFDSDIEFKDGWEKYMLEAVDDMERFKKITKKDCYMVMGGALGAYGHNKKAFISSRAIFSICRGFIYSMKDPFQKMRKLPGGSDEHYFCSILFKEGHVPLRKMKSPIYHHSHGGELFHDNIRDEDGNLVGAIANKYNNQMIREMWNDPYWMLQLEFKPKNKYSNGKYFAYEPKIVVKMAQELKNNLSKIKGIQEFIDVDYNEEPTLKGKDLF